MSAMAHETARDLASAWLDDELTAHDVDELQEHLAGCVECAGHVTSMRALPPLLQALPRVGPSPRLAGAILDRLPATRAHRRTRWLAWRLVPVVVAAVVLAIVAGIALRPGTSLVPFAPVPATAGVAELSGISSLYAERTVVRTPDGAEGSRKTVREKTWWVAPDRLRVERVETAGGRTTTTLTIRRGTDLYVEVDGRPSRIRVAPGLDAVPEPLSAGIAVLGRPTGPGPLVAGRPTTTYELEVEGSRRVAHVDTDRYAVLGGEERFVLAKEVQVGGQVVESRRTDVLRVDEPVEDALFAFPPNAPAAVAGFAPRDPRKLRIAPEAAPRGLDVVAAGVEADGRESLLYQRGAFQVLVTSHSSSSLAPAEVTAVEVGGRAAVLRVPLYGLPSVTFTPGDVPVTVTALLPSYALLQLAADMYLPAE